MMTYSDPLGVKSSLSTQKGVVHYYSLEQLEKKGYGDLSRMPMTVKILVESVLRQIDGVTVTEDHLESVIAWQASSEGEFPFRPSRVLAQDLTGVPAVVDLAAMRDAIVQLGGDATAINPLVPVDLVIDHSVQVDCYGSPEALAYNADREFQRNKERYEILNWASKAFDNLSVVPPATGICHQVNLEYLAKVVQVAADGGEQVAYPDTLVGLDSHTTMVNGLGVLGWGVGGIEAEAAMLGQPVYMPVPQVVGFRMVGQLAPGVTATDLVLNVTQMLREHGVVGRFVEFFGPGLDSLDLPGPASLIEAIRCRQETEHGQPLLDSPDGVGKTTKGIKESTIAHIDQMLQLSFRQGQAPGRAVSGGHHRCGPFDGRPCVRRKVA